jgi:hypothetical protein
MEREFPEAILVDLRSSSSSYQHRIELTSTVYFAFINLPILGLACVWIDQSFEALVRRQAPQAGWIFKYLTIGFISGARAN